MNPFPEYASKTQQTHSIQTVLVLWPHWRRSHIMYGHGHGNDEGPHGSRAQHMNPTGNLWRDGPAGAKVILCTHLGTQLIPVHTRCTHSIYTRADTYGL